MKTYIQVGPPLTAHVRKGAGKVFAFAASSPWANGEEVERNGRIVNDGSYDWQPCIRCSDRRDKGFVRNDFLVDEED